MDKLPGKRKLEGSGDDQKPPKRKKTEFQHQSETADVKKARQAKERQKRFEERDEKRKQRLAEVKETLSLVEKAKGKKRADGPPESDEEAGSSRKKRRRYDSEARESGDDVGDRHHGEEELNKSLEKAIDDLVNEVYIPFFRKYDKEVNEILAQLPGGLEHLDGGSTKEIKLGLDNEKEKELGLTPHDIARMNYAEEQEGIADSTISQKITHLQEVLKKRLDEEKKHKDTTDERKTQIDGQLELLAKHQAYLTSLQEALQKQYEDLGKEVEKYKGQRKALSHLKNLSHLQSALEVKYQDYLTFVNERPLPPETKNFLLDLAVKYYKAELGPKVISPLILSRADKLQIENETFFDEKIARMQELQKRAAEDLGLEDYDHHFFLKSQRHETDFYERHPHLVCLRQEGTDCGPVCTQMVLAGKNKAYLDSTSIKAKNMREQYNNMPPPPPGRYMAPGETYPIMHPIVLKREGHPIEYEYIWSDRLYQWNYELAFYLHQQYSSSTGRDLRKMTVEQFKSAISQKGEEEPIIAAIIRKREDKNSRSATYFRSHFLIIDAIETINKEPHVICRDPDLGKGYAVSLKDFLEVWRGEACIPVGIV